MQCLCKPQAVHDFFVVVTGDAVIHDDFLHNVGGMDFPGIANMFMDDCLSYFNMQWIHFYDDQNSVFFIWDTLKVNELSLKRG